MFYTIKHKKNVGIKALCCFAIVLSILTVALFAGSRLTANAEPDGTSEATAFEIATAEKLVALATAVNAGDTYDGKFVKLTADIDLTGRSWTPIGTSSNPFMGTFDGAGHTVSNLTIVATSACHGLFGQGGANIKNLNLRNVNMTVGAAGGETVYMACGAIIGYASAGSLIENCTVDGVKIRGYGTDIGGIAGDFTDSTIRNCTVKNADIVISGSGIGGVAGVTYSNISEPRNVYFENVKAESGTVTATDKVGGIVGWVYESDGNPEQFDKVFNKASITATAGSAGGVFGAGGDADSSAYENLTVNYAVNSGAVTGTKAGGVIGDCLSKASLSHLYNMGTVSAATKGGIAVSAATATIVDAYFSNVESVAIPGLAIGTAVDTTGMTAEDVFVNASNYIDVLGNGSTSLMSAVVKNFNKTELIFDNNDSIYNSFTINFKEGTYTATIGETTYTAGDSITIGSTKAVRSITLSQVNRFATEFTFRSLCDSSNPTIAYSNGIAAESGTVDTSIATQTIELANSTAKDIYTITLGNFSEYDNVSVTCNAVEVTGVAGVYTISGVAEQVTSEVVITLSDAELENYAITLRISKPLSMEDVVAAEIGSVLNDTSKPWILDVVDGRVCLYSNIVDINSASTSLIINLNNQTAGIFSFKYKVSSERSWDKLFVRLNGTEMNNYSGEIAWTTYALPLIAGSNIITLTYTKDSSSKSGEDTVWISDAKFTFGAATLTAASNNVAYGSVSGSANKNIGDSATFTAIPNAGYTFMRWIDQAGNTVSEDSEYTFTVLETLTYTAVFYENAPVDAATLSYGETTVNVTDGLEIAQVYPTDNARVYTLAIPSIAEGNVVTIVRNGTAVSLDGEGKFVFDCLTIPTQQFTITTEHEGKATVSVSFIVKVNFAPILSSDNSIISFENPLDYPWSATTKDGQDALTCAPGGNYKYATADIVVEGGGNRVYMMDWFFSNTPGKSPSFRIYVKAPGETSNSQKESNGVAFANKWNSFVYALPLDGIYEISVQMYTSSDAAAVAYLRNACVRNEEVSFSVTSNNSSLGNIVGEYNAKYWAGHFVTLMAKPEHGSIFKGWFESDNSFISSALEYNYLVRNAADITAVFYAPSEANTTEDPIDFSSLFTNLDAGSTVDMSYYFSSEQANVYIKEIAGYTLNNGSAMTATDGVYTLPLSAEITFKIIKQDGATINLTIIKRGIGSIVEGFGTKAYPYIINDVAQLALLSTNLDKWFKLADSLIYTGYTANINSEDKIITYGPQWIAIGTDATPFMGSFDGNGWTIILPSIKKAAINGFFASVGATGRVSNLSIQVNYGTAAAAMGSNTAFGILTGKAIAGAVIDNVSVSGDVYTSGGSVGLLVGIADSTAEFNNCQTRGIVKGSGNTGGLSGNGGTFNNCACFADVKGAYLVGGLIGGYSNTGYFTDTYFAGTVSISGSHSNNYPYWGIYNGYGAWVSFNYTRTYQLIRITYDNIADVSRLDVFNTTDKGFELVSNTDNGNGTKTAVFKVYNEFSTASASLLSETLANGVTGNYGGYVIRFTMNDGTYKYLSTLDRANTIFKSNFDVALDELTSYRDNFSTMVIDKTKGTATYATAAKNTVTNFSAQSGRLENPSMDISIYGTVLVNSAEDFEHLMWIVNGGIPTVFSDGNGGYCYYNCRSIVTLSMQLMTDIDLSESTQFWGFGTSEMNPYRGCLYGNYHSITVNMNFPKAYLLGIINLSSDMSAAVYVNNLTVYGTINGGYRVGIVGMNDRYSRSGVLYFVNVKNFANVSATSQVGGMLGYANSGSSLTSQFTNCTNFGNVSASQSTAGGLFGDGMVNSGTHITMVGCANYGNVTAKTYAGGFIGALKIDRCVANFENCNNYGNIKATSNYAGGFIGAAKDVVLTGTNVNYGGVIGEQFVGGIAGRVGNTKSAGSFSNSGTAINAGNVTGTTYVGGLYGYVTVITSIGANVNLGYVKGNANANFGVGGIIGTVLKGTITNAVNYGDVVNSSNNASFAGGIVGSVVVDDVVVTINNNTNYGVIVGKGANTKAGQIVGGLSAAKNAKITINVVADNKKGKVVGVENTAAEG